MRKHKTREEAIKCETCFNVGSVFKKINHIERPEEHVCNHEEEPVVIKECDPCNFAMSFPKSLDRTVYCIFCKGELKDSGEFVL